MKKIILTAAAVFAFGFANAQDVKFGVKAGVDFASMRAKFDNITVTESETGFYLGGFVDVAVSDKFHVQPELLYVSVKDLEQIQLPILAKFTVAEKFNLLAGPNLGFILDPGEGAKSFNFGFDFGASYDVTENLSLDAKYDLGLTNLIEGGNSDFNAKLSGIFVGLGYKF
jgi:opacity protein-like surface antigen